MLNNIPDLLNPCGLMDKLKDNEKVHLVRYDYRFMTYMPKEKEYLKTLDHDISILIIINDTTCPDDYFEEAVNNKHVKKIYSLNLRYNHPKCVFLPIGLGVHGSILDINSINDDLVKNGYPANSIEHLAKYCGLYRKPIDVNAKRHYVLLDFYNGGWNYAKDFGTKSRVWKIRKRYFDYFKAHEKAFQSFGFDFLYSERRLTVKETWEQMTKATFVISPPGNGWDTHRTWEGVVMNKEIIVTRGKCNENVDALGIGIREIKDYKEITPQKLIEYLNDMKRRTYQSEIPKEMRMDYWINRIVNHV
jgi:hypothetical protein